jgi:hypothetical protein
MSDLVSIIFERDMLPYAAGEQAGFPPAEAARKVERGFARYAPAPTPEAPEAPEAAPAPAPAPEPTEAPAPTPAAAKGKPGKSD